MKLTYLQKDITTIDRGIILHGCNCQGVMGSGVAKALRDKWPQIFLPYEGLCHAFRNKQHLLLGNVCFVDIDNQLVIGNMFTQQYYGKDGKVYADIFAIVNGIEKTITSVLVSKMKLPVYMPKIGCGLGLS